MKKYILILVLLVIACKKNEATTTTVKKPEKQNWITDFELFKKVTLQNNKSKVKTFIAFPIKNEGNEIWYVANDQIEISTDSIVPFTEKDFDLYSEKIFSNSFSKCLQLVDSKTLFKTGTHSTSLIKENDVSYTMISTFDKVTNKIELNLALKYDVDNEYGDFEEIGESSIIYYFTINSNQKIKLYQIRLAG
jgi:hypothetical protein